jgi:ATP-dependent Clp protease protease subunit
MAMKVKKKRAPVKGTRRDKDTEAGPKPQIPRGPQPSGDPLYDNNIHMFMTNFNEDSCAMAIRFILEKNIMPSKFKPKHLTLMINSPGGEVPHAFALIDVMKGSSIPIHTVGLGMIASCGVLTFMAGQKGHRIITPNTSILSHQYSWGSRGKEHELFAVVREFELSTERMMYHYKKCTGLTEKKIREVLLPPQDVWLNAEEAVKYGIADKIKSVY